jgi:Tetratricopeptide repeat
MFRSSPGRPPPGRRARAWIVAVALGLAAGVAIWFWSRREPAPQPPARMPAADPRVAASALWPNIHPDVKYVGDAVCAGCHRDIERTYRQHPMGRSLAPSETATALERLDAAAHNPFAAGALRYDVQRKGDRMRHRERAVDDKGNTLFERQVDVDFAVGSGRRGRSYLIGDGGLLFMSPITWYPQKEKGIWDLSPGYERSNAHFTRPIDNDCLFCHSNRVEPVADALNRYQEPIFRGHAIGCERCHGPGELHVAERDRPDDVPPRGADFSIVNPKRLEPRLRDSVCEQCHISGEQRVIRRGRDLYDFRPGLPIEEFWTVFVRRPDLISDHKAVGQVEQMHKSACHKGGRLVCASCHDPHERPAESEKAAYFRGKCLTCHAGTPLTPDPSPPGFAAGEGGRKGAACKVAPGGDCASCHMPRAQTSDIAHTALTDHRILRDPKADRPATPRPLRPGEMPIVAFHPKPKHLPDAEADRDLGVALSLIAQGVPGAQGPIADLALPRLRRAVELWPDDVESLEALGNVYRFRQRHAEALPWFEAALKLAPERDTVLAKAGESALAARGPSAALDYRRRAAAANPDRALYRLQLAQTLAQVQDWPALADEAAAVLRLDPMDVESRLLLALAHLKLGKTDKADAEAETAYRTRPERRATLSAWFDRQKLPGRPSGPP